MSECQWVKEENNDLQRCYASKKDVFAYALILKCIFKKDNTFFKLYILSGRVNRAIDAFEHTTKDNFFQFNFNESLHWGHLKASMSSVSWLRIDATSALRSDIHLVSSKLSHWTYRHCTQGRTEGKLFTIFSFFFQPCQKADRFISQHLKDKFPENSEEIKRPNWKKSIMPTRQH